MQQTFLGLVHAASKAHPARHDHPPCHTKSEKKEMIEKEKNAKTKTLKQELIKTNETRGWGKVKRTLMLLEHLQSSCEHDPRLFEFVVQDRSTKFLNWREKRTLLPRKILQKR